MPIIFLAFSLLLCSITIIITESRKNNEAQLQIAEEIKRNESILEEKNKIVDLMEDIKQQLLETQKVNEELKKQVEALKQENEAIKKAKNIGVSTQASSFKCYMDYRTITDTSSRQYKLRQVATTDENGLRKIGDYYCVAMGTFYGDVGDTFYIETDEGASWKVILADIKADNHTNSTHQYTKANGCIMEFLVDTNKLPTSIKTSGTVNGLGFQGDIIVVKKI